MIDRRKTTRIILARHGEASYPTSGSGDSGGTLTELGRTQARALGDRPREDSMVAVFASVLSRAQQTATIAGEQLGLPVQIRDGLQEYDVGDERGKPFNAELFEGLLMSWLNGDLDVGIPGGEDGHQVAGRMFAVLDDIAGSYAGKTVLVVSHGGAIIAVLGTLAPGETGIPADGSGRLREEDMPGGTHFVLEHGNGSWRFLPRLTGRSG